MDNNTGEPSISIGKTHSRVKIANFQSWLKAWNIYLRCMIHFHSHLTTQLLYYQSQITQFASIYKFQSWSLYDQSFRLRLASKAIARWDFDDVKLQSQHLATTPPPNNPTCWSCKQSRHYSANCLAKSGRATFSSVGGVPPFLAPQQHPVIWPGGKSHPPVAWPARSVNIPGSTCHRGPT